MNLKNYYAKVREVEETFEEADVLVVSLATPDGGKSGVMTLTSRRVAAQLIVEGRARRASVEERTAWESEQSENRNQKTREEIAQRIHIQVLSETDRERLHPQA